MINIVNNNTSYKHSKFTARPMNVNTVLSNKNPHSLKTTASKTSRAHLLSLYQSKELLCWRSNLAFFNLQGNFLSILKALHACWATAKNHKKIVFISTNKPTDTGTCAAINSIVQKFRREYLPRIHPKVGSIPPKAAEATGFVAVQRISVVPTAECVVHGQIKELKKGHPKKKNNSKVANSSKNVLMKLKKLINATTYKTARKQGQGSPIQVGNQFERRFVGEPSYHKLEGLLTKAISRHLTASYGRTPTSFFSNTKKPFQEKFTHLSNHSESLRLSKQLDPSGRVFPLNLNKTSLANKGATPRIESPLSKQEMAWVFRSEKPYERAVGNTKASVLSISQFKCKPEKIDQKQPAELPLAFTSYLKTTVYNQKAGFGDSKFKGIGSFGLKKARRVHSTAKDNSAMYPSQGCRSYDFYDMYIKNQSFSAAKRLASNPNLQQADLVFLTNPDKTPGLASQLKKLGIPSIGIVSGLKTSAYRKEPSLNNLHDSVTYPIVGNPDNTPFVLMIVRLFARLIFKISYRSFELGN